MTFSTEVGERGGTEAKLERRLVLGALVLCVAAVGAVVAACAPGGPLLVSVRVAPDAISPNGDGREDVAAIAYRLARPCFLSIALVDERGTSYFFRDRERRSAGEYEAKFSGVVETPVSVTPFYTVTQASVLPDDHYTVVVTAEEANGHRETVQASLTIVGGDASPPGFGDFSVFTPSYDPKFQATRGDRIIFSPNRDGIGDRVAVSYWLTKEATVQVYLVRTDDPKHVVYPIAEVAKLKPGRHDHDYEGGVDLGNTPPPNGDYLVVGEAQDAIGNHVVVTAPLTIRDGGVPLAQIVSSSISPTTVPIGGQLRIEVIVENVGTVAIRSQGPYSGTVYTTEENFNTKGFFENPGVFRVGVDFEGNTAGRKYPFRWGFENDQLLPGERQTIVGYIQITSKPSASSLYYWVGLEHEQVRTVNDKVKPVRITVGF